MHRLFSGLHKSQRRCVTIEGLGIVVSIVALVVGMLVGYLIRKNNAEKTIGSAETMAKNLILDAENRSETMKKEIVIEAKEEAHRIRTEAEKDVRERRAEIQKSERRLFQKEETVDRKLETLEQKEENITKKQQSLADKEKEIDTFIERQIQELERISDCTAEEAKQLLLSSIEKEVRHEASIMIREIESKAKEEGDKKAKENITAAIQR